MRLRPKSFITTRLIPYVVGFLVIGAVLVFAAGPDQTNYAITGFGFWLAALAFVWWAFRLCVCINEDAIIVVNFRRTYRWKWSEVSQLTVGATSTLVKYHLFPILVVVPKVGRRVRIGATMLQDDLAIEHLWTLLAEPSERVGFSNFELTAWREVGDLKAMQRRSSEEWQATEDVYRRLRKYRRRP